MSNETDTILLVEDNEDDVFALKWAMRKAGLSECLQIVTDGQQALDYLSGDGSFTDRERHPMPTVMFLDLKLPYYGGHEILAWMQERSELSNIAVIILSGSDEGRDHERARENGARAYLVKPPSPEQIVAVLAQARDLQAST
jgi:CheY-like chemotaxis protein